MEHLEKELVPLWEVAEEMHVSHRELKRQLRLKGYEPIEMTARRSYLPKEDWRRFLREIGLEETPRTAG